MEFWEYEVDPTLDYVPVQVYPNGCVCLRFNINELGVEPILYGPSLQNNVKGVFYHDWTIFGAVLHANQAYTLLGLSLHEIRDLRIHLDCLWPKLTGLLCEEMAQASSFQERIAVASRFLRSILRSDVSPRKDFLNAFHDLVSHAATTTDVALIARRSGASTRSLRRYFEKFLGFGPKQMHRLVRVQQGLSVLRREPSSNLSALSARLGYSDQAHFS